MHARSMGSSATTPWSSIGCAHRFLRESRSRARAHLQRPAVSEAHPHLEAPLPVRLRGGGPCRTAELLGRAVSGDGLGVWLGAYEERLAGWQRVELQVMNHAGVRTECVWMNFAPDRLHWARYAGRNFTDRHQAQGPELGPALRGAAGGRAPRGAGGDDGGRPTGRPAAMATVNKSSLRAEFDALKARFESLCAEGKMSAESRPCPRPCAGNDRLEKHTPKSSANSDARSNPRAAAGARAYTTQTSCEGRTSRVPSVEIQQVYWIVMTKRTIISLMKIVPCAERAEQLLDGQLYCNTISFLREQFDEYEGTVPLTGTLRIDDLVILKEDLAEPPLLMPNLVSDLNVFCMFCCASPKVATARSFSTRNLSSVASATWCKRSENTLCSNKCDGILPKGGQGLGTSMQRGARSGPWHCRLRRTRYRRSTTDHAPGFAEDCPSKAEEICQREGV